MFFVEIYFKFLGLVEVFKKYKNVVNIPSIEYRKFCRVLFKPVFFHEKIETHWLRLVPEDSPWPCRLFGYNNY